MESKTESHIEVIEKSDSILATHTPQITQPIDTQFSPEFPKKNFSRIVVVILFIAMVAVWGSVFYLWQKSKIIQPSVSELNPLMVPTPALNPMLSQDWGTYIFKGIQFDYPAGYMLDQTRTIGNSIVLVKEIPVDDLNSNKNYQTLEITVNASDQSVDEYVAHQLNLQKLPFGKFKIGELSSNPKDDANVIDLIEKQNFGSHNFIVYRIAGAADGNYYYFIKLGNLIVSTQNGYSARIEDEEFKHILSSLSLADTLTHDWKSYTNKQLGYSFRYPSDFYIIKTLKPNNIFISKFKPPISSEQGNITLSIDVIDNKENLTPDTYLKATYNPDLYANLKQKETLVAGIKSLEITNSPGIGESLDIYVPVKDKIYTFSTSANDPEGLASNMTIFNNIVSSFIFLK